MIRTLAEASRLLVAYGAPAWPAASSGRPIRYLVAYEAPAA